MSFGKISTDKWWADTDGDRDGIGSDDGLRDGDRCVVRADAGEYITNVVSPGSSTWDDEATGGGGGGGEDLAATLALGSAMGANNIDQDAGQAFVGANNAALELRSTGATGFVHVSQNNFVIKAANPAPGIITAQTLVMGDGTADEGITMFVDSLAQGSLHVTDTSATVAGSLRYDIATAQWAVDAGGIAVGSWDGNRLDAVALTVAGATVANGAIGAQNIVVGDGASSFGISGFIGAGNIFRVGCTDVSGGVMRGGFQMNGGGDTVILIAAGAAVTSTTSTTLAPFSNGDKLLGSAGSRWQDTYTNGTVYGVEPSAAVITAGSNRVIMVDASAAGVTVDLPSAVAGRHYDIIILSAANPISIDAAGGDNVNGAATAAPAVPGRYFCTAEDATDWRLHGPVSVV